MQKYAIICENGYLASLPILGPRQCSGGMSQIVREREGDKLMNAPRRIASLAVVRARSDDIGSHTGQKSWTGNIISTDDAK